MKKQKHTTSKSLLGTISVIMIIVMVGKVTGLIRQALYLGAYGETMESRAFALASLIPRNFLDFAFASTISASFIPIFNHSLETDGKKAAMALANQFATCIFLLSTIATILLFVFATPFVSLVGGKQSLETQALTVELLQLMLPTIMISGLAFTLTGILESFDEFNAPAFMSVISNLLICVYLIFFNDIGGVYGLAIAFLIGWFSQLLILLPAMRKKDLSLRPNFNFTSPPMREIGKLAVPVLISGWVTPINSLVNAAMAGEFNVTLDAAYTLYSVISGVFVLSIANVIFPRLSRMASSNIDEMQTSVESTLSSMLFLLIPLSVGVFLLAFPLVSLAFQRGSFGLNSTLDTAHALQFYTLGMAGFGVQTIVSRAFYAQKDGKTPLVTSLFCISVNFLLSKTLTPLLGVRGPALSWSISLTITSLIMLLVLSRKQAIWTMKNNLNLCKVTAAAFIMGGGVYFIQQYNLHPVMELIISAISGVFIYFIMAFILKTTETKLLTQAIQNWRKK